MKLRCYKAVFPVAFRAEVLGVLIAVLPVGVFAASTMNSGRWFSIELASPVATAASETGRGQAHYGSHDSIAEEQERTARSSRPVATIGRLGRGGCGDVFEMHLLQLWER